ncbi:MAG: cell division protein FtsL [Lactobacillus sp.]|jgi:cell division protein FtsL|nr:cell division protein FtsL [Lactobacillus sp.]
MDNTARKNFDETQVAVPNQAAPKTVVQVSPSSVDVKVPFSFVERAAIAVGSVLVLCFMIALVSARIALGDSQRTLQTVNSQITNVTSNNNDLKQEIGTLNSSDRLQHFAKTHGLTFNEQAVRNVSK